MAHTRAATERAARIDSDAPKPTLSETAPHRDVGGDLDRSASAVSAPAPASPHAFKLSLGRFHYDRAVVDLNTQTPEDGSPSLQRHAQKGLAVPAVLPSTRRDLKRSSSHGGDSDTNTVETRTPPSHVKRRRQSSRYAPPSKYAHLPKLLDILEHDLICVFVGNNPGIRTATAGHAYAHPSNSFWKLLYSSGCTDRRCRPEEDVDLPRLYAMGNTNIVERATKDAAELSKTEMADGTPILEAKIERYRPEAVCIVGKGIWEAIWRYRHGKNPSKHEFSYGWQDEKENMGRSKRQDHDEDDADHGSWDGARVYVTSSTSGLSASLKPAEKEAIWAPFGQWVKSRREERAEAHEVGTQCTDHRLLSHDGIDTA